MAGSNDKKLKKEQPLFVGLLFLVFILIAVR